MEINISRKGLSKKQLLDLNATEDEVLFGGARGGRPRRMWIESGQ